MKEQREFKFLSLSPENESMRPYRQHISMADPGGSYVWKEEKNMTSSYLYGYELSLFSGKYLLVSNLLRVSTGIKCHWNY